MNGKVWKVVATVCALAAGWAGQASAQTPEVKDQLMRNTSDAVDRGVFGSPSFFVGDEIFFGKDRLRDVEEEIVRVKAAA